MRRRRGIGVGVAAVLVALAGGCGDDGGDGGAAGPPATGTAGAVHDSGGVEVGAADEGVDGVVALRVSGNAHDESPVLYDRVPPAGGTHNPVWQNCGRYVEPPPDTTIVHALEHGAVWLAYRPDLGEAAGGALAAALGSRSDKLVISPRDGLPDGAAVVATAWARQLAVTSVDDPRLGAFVDTYVDARTAPEPGGPCAGGYGAPG